MPIEYIVPSLKIVVITNIPNVGVVEERLHQLVQMEEDQFISGYYQRVKKERQKAWLDCHIKFKQFHLGDFVLLYDNKFLKHPGKLQIHQLGPYVVIHITDSGAIHLQQLDGMPFDELVNGSRQKPYQDSCTSLE